MTPMVETHSQEPTVATDLADAIRQVLARSDEPLTPAKIKTALPSPFRSATAEELTDCLNRQVAAQVLTQYPKYRSPHDRYWDRPMPTHVAFLLRQAVQDGPLALFEIRRKLPAYATAQVEPVLQDQLDKGAIHRQPPLGKRGSERFGAAPPDPKAYLRPELTVLFQKLEAIGFSAEQVRAGALELLHEEEWAERPSAPAAPATEERTWASHPPATAPAPHPVGQPAAGEPAGSTAPNCM